MASVSDKVLQYEKFLNEKLKGDLQKLLDQRDDVYSQMAEYTQLKASIENLQENKLTENLKTKVDLGCNFYVQAKVPDPTKVFVFVGFGFFVEMTHSEALKFIDKRMGFLKEHTDRLTKDATEVKANIRLVLEGLREIQMINTAKPDMPVRDLWG